MNGAYGLEYKKEPDMVTIPMEEYESLKKEVERLKAEQQKFNDFRMKQLFTQEF